MPETLIRNARIIDGTGAPWYRGDLVISGNTISRIGYDLKAGPDADVIDAGALIWVRILERSGVDRYRVSEADILYGIAWSMVDAP